MTSLLAATLLLGPWLVVAVHELGHVLAGLAVGRRPSFVRVGTGPSVTVEAFGATWQLGLVPRDGEHRSCLPTTRQAGPRHAVEALGGPIAEAVLWTALAWQAPHLDGLPQALFVFGLALWALTQLPSWLPFTAADGTRSDALQALRAVRGHDPDTVALRDELLGELDATLTRLGVVAPLDLPSELQDAWVEGRVRLDAGDVAGARRLWTRWATRPGAPPPFRALLWHTLATDVLWHGPIDDVDDALDWAAAAAATAPDPRRMWATQAALLVAAGRDALARPTLLALTDPRVPADERATALASLAVAEARCGRLAEARGRWREAVRADPGSPLLRVTALHGV